MFADRLLAQLEETLMYEGPQNVAGIIMEPVTGTNGIIIPPNGYMQGVRNICDKYGIMLIADEVMAGLGRTGEWFAVDNWKVTPDLLCMAKGVTSAYMPLGVVAMSKRVADFFETNMFWGGLTYSAHPMSLAAAVRVLQVMHEDDIVGNSKRMGKVLATHLAKLKEKHPCVGDARSIGLFGESSTSKIFILLPCFLPCLRPSFFLSLLLLPSSLASVLPFVLTSVLASFLAFSFRSFLPFLSFPFLSFSFPFLPFLPFLSFPSFLPPFSCYLSLQAAWSS